MRARERKFHRQQPRLAPGFGPVVGLVVIAAGCGPLVERAPFSYRPDTMAPGDLLGPFEGMVVDAETDRPIAGRGGGGLLGLRARASG